MPARQPFTTLCQELGSRRQTARADLHLHTTSSDGAYSPAQIVELARRSGLAVIAIADHDTLDGYWAASAVAGGVTIIPAVEISAEWRGRELHLLGYFIDPTDAPLNARLHMLRCQRAERFRVMIDRLRLLGVEIDPRQLASLKQGASLGRRHLARLLVDTGRAGTIRAAFHRYLRDDGRVALPKERLPIAEAIALVRQAGGVASWAHPSDECTLASLQELAGLGLGAIEVEYPGFKATRKKDLRSWAARLDLAISGGSDCHGPGEPRRAVGACTISAGELDVLRSKVIATEVLAACPLSD